MKKLIPPITLASLLVGCVSSVEVSPMTQNHYQPTTQASVVILKLKPDRAYVEIADVSAMQFRQSQTEQILTEIRQKAAAVGADAVLITGEETFRRDFVLYRSMSAVALKWTDSVLKP